MNLKAAVCGWIIALTVLPLLAAEIPVGPGEITIPPGESRSLEFGNVPQRDTTVLLTITSRLHTDRLAGSWFLLKVVLNGHRVEAARSRSAVRLVNKPVISPVTSDARRTWYDGHGGWMLLYAPDFEAGRKVPYYLGDPYTLVFDVTDLVDPLAENRLTVANLADRTFLGLKSNEGNLIIQRLTIRTEPGESPMMLAATSMTPTINAGQPAAGPAKYRGRLTPGGGFTVTVGETLWNCASAFSYPNAGLNQLSPSASPDAVGQAGWSVKVQPRDDGGDVLAEGPDYRLRRTVKFAPRKVEVADELTNLHRDSPLGLSVRHAVNLTSVPVPTVRLAGNADPTVTDYYSPPNPSVHISLPDQSIGLLCEDDVFRNQARLFFDEAYPAAGIRTDMLRLNPGETYTLRWSVYPVAGPDYFDFVNLVRQDWGSNFTIDGPWTEFDPDWILGQPIDALRAQIARQGIRYAISIGNWVDRNRDPKQTAFGIGALDDDWTDFRRRLREAAGRIREAAPQVKIMVYYDTQWDTSVDGPERFRDSLLTDERGNPRTNTWGGRYSLAHSVVATTKNSYGRAMLAAVDRYLEETRSDGLYWDELEYISYGDPLITYNECDGHSCLLDPKQYTIQREIGLTTLLGESHRLAVIGRVHGLGGPLLGNGAPCTRALLATKVPRMIETQHNDYWCYEGNLGTPLGYMNFQTDFGSVTRALRMACLPVGTMLPCEHEITRYLFPFTPIELHHGYLLGKERIVAVHDGTYGWVGERSLAQLRHFNRDGKLVDDDSPTLLGAEARTAVTLAEEEAIVLVRLPMLFEPEENMPAGDHSTWNAEVRHTRYGPDAVSLNVRAPHGGVLIVETGEFPLHDSAAVHVRLGDRSQSTQVANRALRIHVPAGFSGMIAVERE